MNILDVIVPIFALIIFGYAVRRLGFLTDRLLELLNNYVYYIGITVITFISLHDTSLTLLLDPSIYLINVLPMALIALLAYAVGKALKLEHSILPVFVICAFFGNTGYIGFPLNVSVQGKDALGMAAFISTIYTVIVFTAGAYYLRSNSEEKSQGLKLYRLPVLWAAILGVAFSWIAIPGLVRLPLEIITDSVSPLALVATGGMIRLAGSKLDYKALGVLSLLKLLALPLAVIMASAAMGITGKVFVTSALEACTPVAVTNTVLAAQYKLKHEFVSNAVIVSTLLFIVTLSIILILIA